jgi:hypothetical protein
MTYPALQTTISGMLEAGEISEQLHALTFSVLSVLEQRPYPAPTLCQQDSTIVLFWKRREDELFLTLGESEMGGVIASPKVKYWRLDHNTPGFLKGLEAFINAETQPGCGQFL